MSWRVQWADPALKDLRRLDPKVRERVFRAVMRFAETGHGDIRKLEGAEDEWRLRVGDWRVRFVYDEDGKEIYVVRVLPRGRAYRD